jgi:hypothetical protein
MAITTWLTLKVRFPIPGRSTSTIHFPLAGSRLTCLASAEVQTLSSSIFAYDSSQSANLAAAGYTGHVGGNLAYHLLVIVCAI